MKAGVARILIDCSLSHFDEQMTGIPRVVLQYVRHGHAFGLLNGISVQSVEQTADGRFYLCTLPERNAATHQAPKLHVAAKILLEILRYLVSVKTAALNLVAAVLPIRPLVKLARAAMVRLPDVISRTRQAFELGNRNVVYVTPGPGDVLLCPSYWHDIDAAVYERVRATGAEVVFLLHDILPVTHPAYYTYPWRWIFERRLARSLDYVGHYYCVSSNTLADVTKFAAQRKKKISASVAYNGFEPLAEPPASASAHATILDRQPWLMVGSLEPKKGHCEALSAFEALWAEGYHRPLLIVGRHGWLCDDIVNAIQTSRWLGDRLFLLEAVGDEELAAIYSRCYAFLFSSFAEGFGLPLLEAATQGLPILARDIATSREILGGCATFFTTAEDLIERVKALEDSAAYGTARQKIARFEWFGWSAVVDNVMADIVRRPQERRTGTNLLDRSLVEPVCGAGTHNDKKPSI